MQCNDAGDSQSHSSDRGAILSFVFEPAAKARADVVARFYDDMPADVIGSILSTKAGRRVLSNRLLFDKVLDHGPLDIAGFDKYPAALTLLAQEQLDCFFLAMAFAEYDEVLVGSPTWPGTKMALKYLRMEGLRAVMRMRHFTCPSALVRTSCNSFSLDSWRARAGALLSVWWADLLPAHRALFSLTRGEPSLDPDQLGSDADRAIIRQLVEQGAHVW